MSDKLIARRRSMASSMDTGAHIDYTIRLEDILENNSRIVAKQQRMIEMAREALHKAIINHLGKGRSVEYDLLEQALAALSETEKEGK